MPSLPRRGPLVLLLAAVPALTGCIQNGRPEPDAVLTESTTEAVVEVGDEIDVRLRENASIGNDWRVVEEPDGTLLELTEHGYGPDDPQTAGSGGTRVFSYRALAPGEAELTLYDCYRCGADGTSTVPEEAREVTFTITIREG